MLLVGLDSVIHWDSQLLVVSSKKKDQNVGRVWLGKVVLACSLVNQWLS